MAVVWNFVHINPIQSLWVSLCVHVYVLRQRCTVSVVCAHTQVFKMLQKWQLFSLITSEIPSAQQCKKNNQRKHLQIAHNFPSYLLFIAFILFCPWHSFTQIPILQSSFIRDTSSPVLLQLIHSSLLHYEVECKIVIAYAVYTGSIENKWWDNWWGETQQLGGLNLENWAEEHNACLLIECN